MFQCLPDWIAPVPLAEAKKELSGSVDLENMERLAPLLHGRQKPVQVHLQFGIDETGIRYLQGTISGAIELICQRCLEALTVPVQLKMQLGIIEGVDEGNRLPKCYEPLMATRDPVRLTNLIEDELLLCLPTVPMHGESEHCERRLPMTTGASEPAKQNPFAALAQLKSKL
ncbi:MAG: YceD family protein [Gammaproteobacteria bacterium]